MPSISLSLSGFTKTNTDMAAGTSFTATATGSTVTGAYITSATLYLSSIRTYSSVGYLTFTRGSGSGTTGTFSSNSSTHSETVSLTGYSDALLTAGGGTVSFTLQRSSSGSGNILNLRSGITGTLTLNYAVNPTACTAPTACTVSNTLSEGNVTLSWSGAAGGTNNTIASYEVQHSESSDKLIHSRSDWSMVDVFTDVDRSYGQNPKARECLILRHSRALFIYSVTLSQNRI